MWWYYGRANATVVGELLRRLAYSTEISVAAKTRAVGGEGWRRANSAGRPAKVTATSKSASVRACPSWHTNAYESGTY
jgi:hypothetical protein